MEKSQRLIKRLRFGRGGYALLMIHNKKESADYITRRRADQ